MNRIYDFANSLIQGEYEFALAPFISGSFGVESETDYTQLGVESQKEFQVFGTVIDEGSDKLIWLDNITIQGIPESDPIQFFILYEKVSGSPVAYIDTIQQLPLPKVMNNSRVFMSFSNGANKFCRYDGTTQTFSTIYTNVVDVTPPAYIPVTRPITAVQRSEKTIRNPEQIYSDFTMMGKAHPLTGDFTKIYNEQSVVQQLKNIFFTDKNELPFGNKIGGSINSQLFENVDEADLQDVKEMLLLAQQNYEPRQTIEDIVFDLNQDKNKVQITIKYFVNSLTDSKEFTLYLTRR